MPDADRVGIFVRPAPEELRHHLALPTGAGLVVYHVTKGSFAERIGLKRYDVIVRLDDELIDSGSQLKGLKKSKGVLGIIRRAKPRKIDLSKVAPPAKVEMKFEVQEEKRREK